MESDDLAGAAALHWPVMSHAGDSAAAAVGALYQSHAVAPHTATAAWSPASRLQWRG